jgi:chitodextrinase
MRKTGIFKITILASLLFLGVFGVSRALTMQEIINGQTSGQILGAATPAFVQAASGNRYGSSVTASFSSPVTAGNTVAVYVAWQGTTLTLNSVTAPCISGNLVANPTTVSNLGRAAMAYGVISTSGPCTITAGFAGGSSQVLILAHEISGVDTMAPLDNNQDIINVQNSPGTGSDAITVTVTTSQSGDYIFGATYSPNGSGSAINAGTGYAQRLYTTDNPNRVAISEDRLQTASGAVSVTFTGTVGYISWLTGLMAFKPLAGPVDITAPSVPTNLLATALSTSQINLSWTASTDNVGVADYTIYRGGVKVGTSATNSYSDIGLNPSTAYTYTVDAYDAAGNHSTQSSAASATTQSPPTQDIQPPTVPANLTATAVSSNQINLSWSPSTDNVGVTGYKIYRNGEQVATTANNNYNNNNLLPSTLYSYTVSAYDAAANNSVQSSSVNITTQAANTSTSLWSGIIDPSRAIDWTKAGFTIQEPASQCANQTGSYSPSGGDDAANINALIAGCTSGGYVLLSSGSFQFTSAGLIVHAISNVVLRGAGPTNTKLLMTNHSCPGLAYVCVYGNPRGAQGIYASGGGGSTTWTGDNGVAGSYAKGDTVLNFGSTTGLSVGQMIILDQDNDSYGFPTSGTGCSESGTTVTCNTTIPHNFSIGDTVAVGGKADPANNDCGQGTAAGYAGWWAVTAVPTSTSFQYAANTAGLAVCTGGYASKDTGGVFVSNVQGQTIAQNSTYIGRSCPDTYNPMCQAGKVSQRNQTEVHVITAINGTNITITAALMMNNWRASQNPGVFWTASSPSGYNINDGIENLTIDSSVGAYASGGTIVFSNSYKSWLRNTRVICGDRQLVDIAASSNIDVMDNYFAESRNGTSETYGVLDDVTSSNNLIQNNIFQHFPAAIISNNDHGSVIAYNYTVDNAYGQVGWLGQGINIHGDSGMVLFEGNNTPGIDSDDIHGMSPGLTLFRNRLRGNDTPAKSQALYANVLSSYNRGTNLIANVLGTVGSETQYKQTGGTTSSGYIYWFDGVGQNGTNIPDDPLVTFTSLRWGNYDTVTGAIHWCGNSSNTGWSTTCSSISEIPTNGVTYISGNTVPTVGDTGAGQAALPTSLYLSGQPSFWTVAPSLGSTPPWPALGPDVTTGTALDTAGGHSYAIPAQLCYENTGFDPAYQTTLSVTGASWSSGSVTLTTKANTLSQYDTIVVSGITPSAYNGTFQVTQVTATSVKYALPSNPGTYVSEGQIGWPNILLFNAANCYYGSSADTTPPSAPTGVKVQ